MIAIVEDGFDKTPKLLERNRSLLDQVATLLTQVEAKEGETFQNCVSSYTSLPKEGRLEPVLVLDLVRYVDSCLNHSEDEDDQRSLASFATIASSLDYRS